MEVLPTANFQPDIYLSGLRLGEPVIGLTSILVSMLCFYAWSRLGRIQVKDDALKLARLFFLLMSFSTLIGAVVGHFFLYCFPFAFKTPGWALGMIAVSALEQSSIIRARAFTGKGLARALGWINILELTIALAFVSSTLWFPGVEIHSAFGILCIVLPLEIYLYLKGRSSSKYILSGILLLIVSVLVHILKISLSVWFCYFDIAHVLMAATFWLFMLGLEADHRQGVPGTEIAS